MLVKISVLPSVNVIYLRIDHKLITIFVIEEGKEYTGKAVVRFLNLKTVYCTGDSDQSCSALYMCWVRL